MKAELVAARLVPVETGHVDEYQRAQKALRAAIAAEIEAAVDAERQACLRDVATAGWGIDGNTREQIRDAIRARALHEAKP